MHMALLIWAEWVTNCFALPAMTKSEVSNSGKKIQPHLHLFVGGAFYEIYFFNLQMKNYEKASIIRSFEKCNRKMQGMDEQVEKR